MTLQRTQRIDSLESANHQHLLLQLNDFQEGSLAEALNILEILKQHLDSASVDNNFILELVARLNQRLQEASQLADLCEDETGVLVEQSSQNVGELQNKINSLQVSIRETREQIEHLQQSEVEFGQAENQLLAELKSIESAIADASRRIEQAKSHKKKCLIASVFLLPLVIVSPVLFYTAMGPITSHIENYEKIRKTTQQSASLTQDKLRRVEIQLADTAETANQLQTTLEEANEQLGLTEEKRQFWADIHLCQREIQAQIRLKCLTLGNMAATVQIPMALVANKCFLPELVKSSIVPLEQQFTNSTSPLTSVEDAHEWQLSASLRDVDIVESIKALPLGIRTQLCQLISAPVALLRSIVQFSSPNDVCLSAELSSMQLKMGNHAWKALKVIIIKVGQLNKVTSFLDGNLQTTGQLMQTQLRQSKESLVVDWTEIDQRLVCFKSQSPLLTKATQSIKEEFDQLFNHLNSLIVQLVHDKQISEETKSALIRDIREIDGQMTFVEEKTAETIEEMRLQREVVDDVKNDFVCRIQNLRDCEWAIADFAIELTMDVIFLCVPFMEAFQFLDETVVLGRYLLRKAPQLISYIKQKLSGIRKTGVTPADIAEANRNVSDRMPILLGYADTMWKSFVDSNERLRPHITSTQVDMLLNNHKVALGAEWLVTTVSCPMVDTYAGHLCAGLLLCQRLEEFCNRPNYDSTTDEADQIVTALKGHFEQLQAVVAQKVSIDVPKPSKARWYHVLMNGICGYKAIHQRYNQEVLQQHWQNEDANLERKKEQLRSQVNSLHYFDQQNQYASYKLESEEIYARQVVDLTKCLTAMKLQVFHLVRGFNDSCRHLNYAAEQLGEENQRSDDPTAMLVGRKLAFAQYKEAVDRLKEFQPTFSLFESFCTRFYMQANNGNTSGEDYHSLVDSLELEVQLQLSQIELV